MPFKVLIYSRFPKAMMASIGQRFELMDSAGNYGDNGAPAGLRVRAAELAAFYGKS